MLFKSSQLVVFEPEADFQCNLELRDLAISNGTVVSTSCQPIKPD